ncbi:F0F1 ATP synthase subunit epsilon [Maribacter sp. ACAM166]|uniref:F0F1 ATP synthase subunit epsilon n=1 Tax=Maribacter sp. ACAM166 TaxID=2508996 RepID=UPI0010FD61F3|nr:F0F1 ATP synthase subunit epsilon [Maribacter sp. ACAM166]TLP72847.1 F0F1 ATP synthase subunit epsilon [Maribacter sp. ACAM166]
MSTTLMHLKILLPYGVFADIKNVKRIVAETTAGSYGILPRRLDCTAALVTGILLYETESEGEKYIAVNEGILIKAGEQVSISVRNAIGNAPLGKLKAKVEKEMVELDEQEVSARIVMAKLETGFLRSFQKLRK